MFEIGEVSADEQNEHKHLIEPTELQLLERLCNGQFKMEPKEEAKIYCYYKRDKPFLMLAPHKVEIVRLQPLLLIFRAVISHTEISVIKKLATPKLRQAEVVDSDAGKVVESVSYRSSKSAWLNDAEHPLVSRLNRRVHEMTNLDIKSAEDLQVASYGPGGHYAPHYDFFTRNEVNPIADNDLFGNRVATVLFYLTQPHAGGRTIFTDLHVGVAPSEHDALFWYNLHEDGSVDLRTRHVGKKK
uniref:Fe2OG dioxygenase domain-containing protein n=1 Tax=Globodera rostochiensis TaxID=31243 RepID=A0A914HLS0_GLORO